MLGYASDHTFTQAFTQKDTLVKHTIEEKANKIKISMWINQLQIKDTKTELFIFGNSNQLSKIDLD